MYPLPESTRDLYDEVATLRQEAKEADRKLAISETACASAMAEVEALTRDNVDAGRRIGESNDTIDQLQRRLTVATTQRDTWRTMHHEVETELKRLRNAIKHVHDLYVHGNTAGLIVAAAQLGKVLEGGT